MPKFYSWDGVVRSLPDYDFIEHIDSGGFKDVFLVDVDEGNIVVKLLPIEKRSRKRRARREGEAMRQIEHQNFVKLIDYYEANVEGRDTFIIEEEHIDGPTLSEKLDVGGHGLDLGVQTVETILEILIEFDEKGMIHRDIKPQNIMIDASENVRLLDVGIVRFQERDTVTPDHQDRLGTPNYGAPEQLDYDRNLQSIRTDLFSTGIVMFETITGIHPFSNQGKSISKAIMAGDRQSIVPLIADEQLADELDFFFSTMTETEPYKRFRRPKHAMDEFRKIKRLV